LEESGYIPLIFNQDFYRRYETSYKTRIGGISMPPLVTDQYAEALVLQEGCHNMIPILVFGSPMDDLDDCLALLRPIEIAGEKELVE
jgi:hypothetical protein